jgi:hypothetical protein
MNNGGFARDALIAALVVSWLGMGIYVGLNKIKLKKS